MNESSPANVTMRVCGWCESVHPEHISISWFPDRMYFCIDGFYGEWASQAAAARRRPSARATSSSPSPTGR